MYVHVRIKFSKPVATSQEGRTDPESPRVQVQPPLLYKGGGGFEPRVTRVRGIRVLGPLRRTPKPRPEPGSPDQTPLPPIYIVNVGGKAPISRSNPEFRRPAMGPWDLVMSRK
jgi:hypothetical protein